MDNAFLESFIERFQRDKEVFNNKFEEINRKLQNIESKFDNFDIGMKKLDERLDDIDETQEELFYKLGEFMNNFDNVEVYLSTIECKLKEYETLYLEGEKMLNGSLIKLRIELQKVKPIINWENNLMLTNKYNQIEQKLNEFEES